MPLRMLPQSIVGKTQFLARIPHRLGPDEIMQLLAGVSLHGAGSLPETQPTELNSSTQGNDLRPAVDNYSSD
jgi:hypothetical protein